MVVVVPSQVCLRWVGASLINKRNVRRCLAGEYVGVAGQLGNHQAVPPISFYVID